jgi:hypothetical protein
LINQSRFYFSNSRFLAVLTNLQKINSLPVEVQAVSLDTTVPINRQETSMNSNESNHNGHDSLTAKHITTNSIPIEKPSTLQNLFIPPPPPPMTTKIMNQMKNLTVSSATTNVTLTSAIQSSAPSYLSEYEITDTSTKVTTKKSSGTIAAFPPRPASTPTEVKVLPSNNQHFSSKTNVINKENYEQDILSNECGIRFGTTPRPQPTPTASSMYAKPHEII